jgi:amino acid adenylation domain-containing protein
VAGIDERFAAVAAAQPDAPAVVADAPTGAPPPEPVSYAALAEAAERVAEHLRRQVAPGEVIATSIRKQPAAVAVMLGCLRAGVAYVPIDPAAPAHRRRQILDDARPRLVLTGDDTAADLTGPDFADLVACTWPPGAAGGPLATLRAARRDGRGDTARGGVRDDAPGDLAYVLYTSGSTGRPKGVLTSRENASFFVDWTAREFPLGAGDRVAQHAPLHFDLPVYDVFTTLVSGATVHLMDARTTLFPAACYAFLRERAITSLYAVPSALSALVTRSPLRTDGLPALRRLLYAGEEFPVPRLREFRAALPGAARVVNLYGPVETNVVTWQEVDADVLAGRRVPIGRAVPGLTVRLLDGAGRMGAAPGDEGEIVVAGPSVSPGYLGDPERTSATRVLGPVDGGVATYYRTGDFARVDPAGRLCFQGRRDGMVKTRGFRVEIGDVEAALVAHPAVTEAVVSPVPHAEFGTVLAAHVTVRDGARSPGAPPGDDPPSERELQRWVGGLLPAYMVPASVRLHAALPTTSTGKVARAELAAESR